MGWDGMLLMHIYYRDLSFICFGLDDLGPYGMENPTRLMVLSEYYSNWRWPCRKSPYTTFYLKQLVLLSLHMEFNSQVIYLGFMCKDSINASLSIWALGSCTNPFTVQMQCELPSLSLSLFLPPLFIPCYSTNNVGNIL